MPSSAPQIPAERIVEFARARWDGSRHENAPRFDELPPRPRREVLQGAREDAQEAYPHLLAAFKEQLFSDEAIASMLTLLGERGWGLLQGAGDPVPDPASLVDSTTADLRTALEAALASIESNGGTDRA